MSNIKDKDLGLKNIKKLLKWLKNTKIKVGVFADATNTKKTDTTYVADYAIANEYGTKNIPERSFMRSSAHDNEDTWNKEMETSLINALDGGNDVIKTRLYNIGQRVRSDIIKKIDSNILPQNAPSTQKRKLKQGKNKTLVDTGALRQSIEARIE